MGFKAKARKHRKEDGSEKKDKKDKSKQGELSCGVNECEKFADKSLGGRSLSLDNASDMWGDGKFSSSKGRVRVCKSCYRSWKKENKSDETY